MKNLNLSQLTVCVLALIMSMSISSVTSRAVSGATFTVDINNRNHNRNLGIEITENGLNFDGNLEDLYDQAYEKVSQNPPAPTSTTDDTHIGCKKEFDSVDVMRYRFDMEYENGYDPQEVLTALEEDMNNYIASELMPCAATNLRGRRTRVRVLQEEIGLVKIDSNFPDEITGTLSVSCSYSSTHILVPYSTLLELVQHARLLS
jgi:hypothetical protein